MRTDLRKRLTDSSDAPKARHGIFPKTLYKAPFHTPSEEWVLPDASTKETEEREFVVDSGSTTRRIVYEIKTSPKYSNPTMHEKGENKRAQELRVDEASVQKIKENHETTQKLTSQLQQMQEQLSLDMSKMWNQIIVEVVSRFQSACNGSKFSFHAEPRQTLAS